MLSQRGDNPTRSSAASRVQRRMARLYYDTDTVDVKLVGESLSADVADPSLSSSTCKEPNGLLAHRCILAAASDALKALLLGTFHESRTFTVRIEGVTQRSLVLIKRYLYLGELPELPTQTGIDGANVLREVLQAREAAQMLMLADFEECLVALVQNHLFADVSACLRVYGLAYQPAFHDDSTTGNVNGDFLQEARRVLTRQGCLALTHPDITLLPDDAFVELITNPGLCADDEAIVEATISRALAALDEGSTGPADELRSLFPALQLAEVSPHALLKAVELHIITELDVSDYHFAATAAGSGRASDSAGYDTGVADAHGMHYCIIPGSNSSSSPFRHDTPRSGSTSISSASHRQSSLWHPSAASRLDTPIFSGSGGLASSHTAINRSTGIRGTKSREHRRNTCINYTLTTAKPTSARTGTPTVQYAPSTGSAIIATFGDLAEGNDIFATDFSPPSATTVELVWMSRWSSLQLTQAVEIKFVIDLKPSTRGSGVGAASATSNPYYVVGVSVQQGCIFERTTNVLRLLDDSEPAVHAVYPLPESAMEGPIIIECKLAPEEGEACILMNGHVVMQYFDIPRSRHWNKVAASLGTRDVSPYIEEPVAHLSDAHGYSCSRNDGGCTTIECLPVALVVRPPG